MSERFQKILDVFMEEPNGHFTGSQVMQKTRIHAGIVYPTLARMTTTGWLEASWSSKDKKTRQRLHTLTKGGHRKGLKREEESTGIIEDRDLVPALE